MSQGVKFILIIVAGLILIAGAIFFILPRRAPEAPAVETVPEVAVPTEIPTVEVSPEIPAVALERPAPLDEQERTADILRQMASAFAERFGSFSSHMNFENITDLYSVMTPSLRGRQEEEVAEMRKTKVLSESYSGVTTRALAVEITALNPEQGSATVAVKTQRQESTVGETKIRYQDLELKLRRVGTEWRVDEATWK